MTKPAPLARAPITATSLDPRDEEDLRWYHCDSRGSLGLKSAFGFQLERAREGSQPPKGSVPMGSSDHEGVTLEMVHAAERQRRIAGRLALVGRVHRSTLAAAYGEAETPHVLTHLGPSLSRRSRLALLIARRLGMGRTSLYEAVAGTWGGDKDKARGKVAEVQKAMDEALRCACLAYQDACREMAKAEKKRARRWTGKDKAA
jgi:hypothetical protein